MIHFKFTCIIATCNSEKTIEKCINSILSQNYQNYEIIIIDNISSDKTLKIVSKFNSKKITIISEMDTGIYNAWNKGLDLATGDYIHFLGSDDFFNNNDVYLQVINNLNSVEKPIQCVSTGVIVVNEKYDTIYSLPPGFGGGINKIMYPFMGLFFSISIFRVLKGFDESYKICGDYEFFLRITKLYNIHILENIFTICMLRGGVSSSLKNMSKIGHEILRSNLENNNYFDFIIYVIYIRTVLINFLGKFFGYKSISLYLDRYRIVKGQERFWSI